ncbi:MAG: polysaccharide biosynthesis protein [Polaromonas sp.]|nr:polysaccharide biosynthesis protein [Polaromonas sp.]
MSLVATWTAFTLRLDTPHWPGGLQWYVYAVAPLLAVPIFIRFGLYRAIFRYSGQAAMLATAKAVSVSGLLLLGILLWQKWPGVPRTVGALQPLVFLLLVGASRAIARFWLAGVAGVPKRLQGRLLIFGAGMAGAQTASAMGISGQYVMLGFIDDDPAKVGRSINGVPVFAAGQVPAVVEQQGVTDILLALPSASRARRNGIIDSLRSLPVHIRTLPGLADLASGRVTVRDFRELDVEDLLGRNPVPPDLALLARSLAGQVVLVTGAGGSIGGELCRQIVTHRPRHLVLFDHNEFGLYTIHAELEAMCAALGLTVELQPVLGSVGSYPGLQALFQAHRPALVYHAAAYKHVPLVESNAGIGIANNVFGTLNVARAALEAGTGRFVLVSTDKAVRPTNIMGASKRMAELVLQALSTESAPSFAAIDGPVGEAGVYGAGPVNRTCFTTVRFGNVLDSSGSVVPLFRKQLEEGGPLTVTHLDVTRYFMTIPEAAQLVLQAGAMAQGGEVFVLDMGEPVKIYELAERMVRLSGLSLRDEEHPEGDIAISITGLRPGEKLYEELLIGDNPEPTAHPRIMKAREDSVPWARLAPELHALQAMAAQQGVPAIRQLLSRHVQGYEA